MFDGELPDEEIWLRAYCGALANGSLSPYKEADQAVQDFHARFPNIVSQTTENHER